MFGKGLLTVKLKLPQGTTLSDTEANYVIDGWESQKTVVRTRQNDMTAVSDKIDRHLSKLNQQIPEALRDLKAARASYRKVVDPLAKRKWARKVVVRTSFYDQVRTSQHSLVSTVERVKDAVDDAQFIYKTLESRIIEARIYRELNGGLKLVGKSLMEAKTKHIMPEIEYNNLEVSMEAIEAMASGKQDDQLLVDAEQIANDPERWASDNEGKEVTNKKKATKRSEANA